MTDLLSCPFCGGAAVAITGPVQTLWGVTCLRCACWFDDRAPTDAAAIAAWNTRTPTPAPNAGAVNFSPMETAPKDGTLLRLLVDYSDDGSHPLEDATQAWTIGFNDLADTEDDVWQFAGWSWEQDCFTEGHGEVIGWLPLHTIPAVTPPPAQVKPLSGWVIANGQGNRWRCVWKWETNAEWTDDISKAIKFATREDAEAFSAEDEDAWLIQEVPIPAIELTPDPRDAVIARLVEALGETLDAIEGYNRTLPDEDGLYWDRSDLITQEIMSARAALAAAKEVMK